MYTGPHTHSAIAQLPLLLLQVAARMYTGPMYMKYNLVLRGMGAGRHTKIHEEYERVCKLNTYTTGRASNIVQAAHGPRLLLTSLLLPPLLRYTTTLHVINSAIIKLSKLTSATKLYRGVSGALLPRPFWTPNQYNVRGGVEVAFMSRTWRLIHTRTAPPLSSRSSLYRSRSCRAPRTRRSH